MSAHFVYESTHVVKEHQLYWDSSKIVKKPSPSQLSNTLHTLLERRDPFQQDAIAIASFDAWSIVPYVFKQMVVRNELGLWSDMTNDRPEPNEWTTPTAEKNSCFFVGDAQDFCKEQQTMMAKDILQSDDDTANELCNNFLILGYMSRCDTGQSCILLHFAHIDHKSISINILRPLLGLLQKAGVSKALVTASSVVRRVISVALSMEFPNVEFEFWTDEEMMFDWFGSRINNPMVVCKATKCLHLSADHTVDDTTQLCDQCSINNKTILGHLASNKHALPFILPQCMIAKRFAMQDGDLLDSARPTGRFLRHCVPLK